MCEPSHSIVQYPSQDDGGSPTAPLMDAIEKCQPEGWFARLKKRIGGWFHFSKMGYGHSEALLLTPESRRRLPTENRYEAWWWVRKVALDGQFFGPDYEKVDALECATAYAHKVSVGNLTLWRQFIESSMRLSKRPHSYETAFVDLMLTAKGRDAFKAKSVRVNKSRWNLETAIKLILGFSRKRELLVPEWADDTKLWVPSPQLIGG